MLFYCGMFMNIFLCMQGTGLEYDRYLQEVFRELETDDNFRKKLESINISDIKVSIISIICVFS